MIRRIFTLIAFVVACTAQAQSEFVKADSLPSAVTKMVEASENKLFHDTRTPRFVMIDKTQKFIFGVGGYLSAMGYYDLTGNSSSGFAVDNFRTPFDPLRSDRVGLDITSSRIAFKMLGDTKWGVVEVTFECAFTGPGNTFALRKGYVRLGNFLVGKDWSITTDLAAAPTTIDPAGPPSMVGYRMPVIRYAFNISPELRSYFSLEFPDISGQYMGESVELSSSIPDLNTKFLWRPTKSYTGQLTTILRYLKSGHGNIPDGGFCFGVAMSHQVKIGRSKLYAQGVFGRGISDYISGSRSHHLNVVADPIERQLRSLWAYGVTCAYTLNWNDQSYSNVIGSYVKMFSHKGQYDPLVAPSTMRDVFYVATNYLLKLDKYCTVGGEVLYGNKIDFSRMQAHGLRTSILLRYDF